MRRHLKEQLFGLDAVDETRVVLVDDGQLLTTGVDVDAAQRRVQLENGHWERIVNEYLQHLRPHVNQTNNSQHFIRQKLCYHCEDLGNGGGGHWLVQMEWRPAGSSVCLPLLISPCTIKSRSSLLAPAHPGGPGKRAVKWLWCGCGITVKILFSVLLRIHGSMTEAYTMQ